MNTDKRLLNGHSEKQIVCTMAEDEPTPIMDLLSPVHRFMRFLGFYNSLFDIQIHKTAAAGGLLLLHRLLFNNVLDFFTPRIDLIDGKLLVTFDWALAMGNLLYFAIRRRTHVEMLRSMDEHSINGAICCVQEWKTAATLRVRMFFLAVALFFCITLSYGVHGLLSFTTMIDIHHDWRVFVGPLHMLWNVLPICYFLLCNSFFNQLHKKYRTIDGENNGQMEDCANKDGPKNGTKCQNSSTVSMELPTRQIFNAKRAFFQPLLYFWLFWSVFVCLSSVHVLVQYPNQATPTASKSARRSGIVDRVMAFGCTLEIFAIHQWNHLLEMDGCCCCCWSWATNELSCCCCCLSLGLPNPHRYDGNATFGVSIIFVRIGWFLLQTMVALFHLYVILMNIKKT